MGIHGMSRGTLVFGVPVPVGKLNGEGKDDLRRQGPEPRSTAKWPVRFGRNSRNRLTCISLYNRHHIKHYRTISFLWFFEFGNMSASFRSICPSAENYLSHDMTSSPSLLEFPGCLQLLLHGQQQIFAIDLSAHHGRRDFWGGCLKVEG